MLSLLFHRQTSLLPSAGSRGKISPAPPEKSYPRFPRIACTSTEADGALSLRDALRLRASAEDFSGTLPPTLDDISAMLNLAARPLTGEMRRPYPSGGASYPLEIYIATSDLNGHSGLFHYLPKEHSLEHLFPSRLDCFEDARGTFSDPWSPQVPAFLLISGVWGRTMRKYGDFGYRLILFEAGHLAQNMLLSGAARGLSMRPSTGFDADDLGDLLDFRQDDETILYAIALGKRP